MRILKLGESTDVSIFSKLMAEWAPFVLTPIYIYMRPRIGVSATPDFQFIWGITGKITLTVCPDFFFRSAR